MGSGTARMTILPTPAGNLGSAAAAILAACGSVRPPAASLARWRDSSSPSRRQRPDSGKSSPAPAAAEASPSPSSASDAWRAANWRAMRKAHGKPRDGGSTGKTSLKSPRSMPRSTSHHAKSVSARDAAGAADGGGAISASGVTTSGGNAARPRPEASSARASRRRRPDCLVGTTTIRPERSSAPSPFQPAARNSAAWRSSGRSQGRKWRRTLGGGMGIREQKRGRAASCYSDKQVAARPLCFNSSYERRAGRALPAARGSPTAFPPLTSPSQTWRRGPWRGRPRCGARPRT